MELDEVYEVMEKSNYFNTFKENEVFNSLSKSAQVFYFSTVLYYHIETDRGTKALSRERLNKLKTPALRVLFDYLFFYEIDCESDSAVVETLDNVLSILNEREPLPPHKPKTEEEIQADLKRLFERAGYEYKP